MLNYPTLVTSNYEFLASNTYNIKQTGSDNTIKRLGLNLNSIMLPFNTYDHLIGINTQG